MTMNGTLAPRIIVLSLASLLAGVPVVHAAGPDSLRIYDAVRIVLATHPAVTMSEERTVAADARVGETQTSWNPTLTAEGNYTYLAPIAAIEFGGASFRLFPAHNLDAHVALRQQVLDFGKTSKNTDLRQSQVEGTRLVAAATRAVLAYQTIQTFDAVLYLRSAVAVQGEQIRTLEEHIAVMQKRVSAGTGTEFDVLTSEVRVASVRNQRTDLATALAKAEVALARLLGRGDFQDCPLSGTFTFSGPPPGPDSLIGVALQHRQELLTAKNEEESAALEVGVTGSSDLPSVNAGISYGVRNGLMPNLDVLRGNLAASVRVEVPILDGGRAARREEGAEAMLRAAHAKVLDVQAQIGMEVRQALSELLSASEKVATSALQVRHAREALDQARKRFDAGTITNLDLLDVETALEQAELMHLQSLYAQTSSRSVLDKAVGAEPWK